MNEHKGWVRFAPQGTKAGLWLEATLWLILLIVPLVIGLMWGAHFDDGVYAAFRCARSLATEPGLIKEVLDSGQDEHRPRARGAV